MNTNYCKLKSYLLKSIKGMGYFLLLLAVSEIILRMGGIKPFPHFSNEAMEKYVESHFKDYMCNDDGIGIIPCPSKERIIYLADKIPYKVSHLSDGSRYCGNYNKAKDIILITGDSNTHGAGVNDSDHVGFKLQELLPNFHIINRSIPGSGNISQLMVLKNSLKNYKPKLIIATYGSYHNDRNVFARSIKKIFRVPQSKIDDYRFPNASLKGSGLDIFYSKYEYTPVPFSNYLASAELINLILEKYDHKMLNAELVTQKIWEEYVKICRINQIKLCVIVLSNDAFSDKLSMYLKSNEVTVIPIQFKKAMTFSPIDGHPNKKGHIYLTSTVFTKLNSVGWLK
jgi:hypothetical protein